MPGIHAQRPVDRALESRLVETCAVEHRTDDGDVSREASVRGTGESHLQWIQIGTGLLGDCRLEGLRRGADEERPIDVPVGSDQRAVGGDNGDGSLVCSLDETGPDLFGEQTQLTGASSCWLRYRFTISSWSASMTWCN